ncbi:glucosamine-6-phosphate deaminase [Liquorilactobacillus vini]|uniref:Glucosamine-6-phosphate deaminase n=1 Tax=Liquorilactobacillus vini DSM 20605 TaxID=1133569 RepID=A0A0R2CE62_9LACO|nr:glucosamine-6-phosphate deaminase [Liquorilactobacillus vini]KRM86665.1 glucosamine-6-phosphate isomerase [Liquorilactobacillus vini DSM 20605]
MKIIIVKNKIEGGKKALEIYRATLKSNARVLGFATGSTPLTTYQELIKSDLDFSQIISFNLDEYVGLQADDPQSYHHYMEENLFKFKKFKTSFLLNGVAVDEKAEIRHYDQLLEKYPIDLQLLGIGRNGHIGFNEPGSSFNERTHKVGLTESTIKANSRFFADEVQVPRYAYSMGIKSILAAKQILLEAYGSSKASAVLRMVQGPMTTACPASILQTHPNVTLILDEAAASQLSK